MRIFSLLAIILIISPMIMGLKHLRSNANSKQLPSEIQPLSGVTSCDSRTSIDDCSRLNTYASCINSYSLFGGSNYKCAWSAQTCRLGNVCAANSS